MTRLEKLQSAVYILDLVNAQSQKEQGGDIYKYKIDKENLMIIIKNKILYKTEANKIDYIYIEFDKNELTLQF